MAKQQAFSAEGAGGMLQEEGWWSWSQGFAPAHPGFLQLGAKPHTPLQGGQTAPQLRGPGAFVSITLSPG